MPGDPCRAGISPPTESPGSTKQSEGRLLPLTPQQAGGVALECAHDRSILFFRVIEKDLRAAESGCFPLRDGDVLVVREGVRPYEGDLIVVELDGEAGYRLGRSRREGNWCLLIPGAALPLGAGAGFRLVGVVMGAWRTPVRGEI